MKVGNLWRSRYDELLKENIKLKERNKILTSQLIATIVFAFVAIIYGIIEI